jgi:putative nucleotidyltransferase with HDIG domain
MSRERIPRIIETLAVGAAVALAAAVAFGDVPTSREWNAAVFFTAFGILASILSYRGAGGAGGSIGFLPFLGAALIAPNMAAILSVLVSIVVSEVLARRPLQKLVFNVSSIVFAHTLAIGAYVALGGVPLVAKESPAPLAFIAMGVVFFSVNKLAVSTVIAHSSGSDTFSHWARSMRASALYDVLAFPLILFFASVYARAGWEIATAFVIPVIVMRQLYKATSALSKVNEELLQLMVAAIEARDPYTSGHSQRVARYAGAIARSMNLSGRVVDRIATAALLHDVGKIHEEFAPILRKPGRLTEDEFEVMKTHSAKSAALIQKVSHFADLVPMVQSHHEAWDGRGYPHGLSGSDIPLGARIIALADTIDAMSTSRPYRRAMTTEEVRDELVRESGHQFDPVLCRKLLNDVAWRALTREITTATRDYPVSTDLAGTATDATPGRLQLTS